MPFADGDTGERGLETILPRFIVNMSSTDPGERSRTCRVCGARFFPEPLLHYENMPVAAQSLPDANSLDRDKGVDLEVCQCFGCGLVQLNGAPVPYYKDVIRAAAVSPEMKEFRSGQFSGFVKRFHLEGRKVVEVGCGRGEYLSIMHQCGVDAYGLEHAEESVRQCVAAGLKVSRAFPDSGGFWCDEAPFDAFFMLAFLEHLPDPNASLQGIQHILADGAVGLVEVPNFDMILRKKLFSEFIGDHLFYFTKETFATTLQCNGFEIIDCTEEWHEYILSALVRKRGSLDISDFHAYQSKLQAEMERFIGRFPDKKVAVWARGTSRWR